MCSATRSSSGQSAVCQPAPVRHEVPQVRALARLFQMVFRVDRPGMSDLKNLFALRGVCKDFKAAFDLVIQEEWDGTQKPFPWKFWNL